MAGLGSAGNTPWSLYLVGSVLAGLAVIAIVVLTRVFGASLRSISLRNESERLKSEVALARAEARFRTVFEGAPLGIVVIDVDGTLRETNAAFDLDAGLRTPRTDRQDDDRAHRRIRPRADDRGLRRARPGRGHRPTSTRCATSGKNGSTLWADVSVTYVPEDDEPFAIAVDRRRQRPHRHPRPADPRSDARRPDRLAEPRPLLGPARRRAAFAFARPRGRVRRPRSLQGRQRQPRPPRRRRAAARGRAALALDHASGRNGRAARRRRVRRHLPRRRHRGARRVAARDRRRTRPDRRPPALHDRQRRRGRRARALRTRRRSAARRRHRALPLEGRRPRDVHDLRRGRCTTAPSAACRSPPTCATRSTSPSNSGSPSSRWCVWPTGGRSATKPSCAGSIRAKG